MIQHVRTSDSSIPHRAIKRAKLFQLFIEKGVLTIPRKSTKKIENHQERQDKGSRILHIAKGQIDYVSASPVSEEYKGAGVHQANHRESAS